MRHAASQSQSAFTRIVPTASLRSGVLTFQDASGQRVAYPLATSTLCGTGATRCDARGLGLSPTVREMFAVMPQGNDATLGDGLNTTGFRGEVSQPITFDTVTGRFDHNLTSKLQLSGRYSYQRNLTPQIGQLDIRDPSNIEPLRALDNYGASVIAGLEYQMGSNWLNSFRFGWVQNRSDLAGTPPSAVADRLGLPGTDSSIGAVGVDLAPTLTGGLDEAISVASAGGSDPAPA